jgi:hypothetical protein
MIYLKHTTDLQLLCVPKTERNALADVTLRIKCTSTCREVTIESSEGNSSLLYYKMMIALPDDVVKGEYEYTLSDDMGVLSTGLMVIGDTIKMKEYNTTIEYEQYRKS